MSATSSNDKPREALTFELGYHGYWTGDYECPCFADHPDPELQDPESRQYIELPLDRNKRWRVRMTVEAIEVSR